MSMPRRRMQPAGRPFLITSLAQIRALASPVRQEIVDALAAMGPLSVATLAHSLGRAPNAIYFHIRKLERLGLLVRLAGAAGRGRPSVSYDVPGRPMTLAYQPDQPTTRQPMGKLVRAMLSTATRIFVRAYSPDVAVVAGAERNLWASRSRCWLSPRELTEVNRHLRALVVLLNQTSGAPAGDRQLMELTFVLAPVTGARRTPRAGR